MVQITPLLSCMYGVHIRPKITYGQSSHLGYVQYQINMILNNDLL